MTTPIAVAGRQADLSLLLGRLDGKMDLILLASTSHEARIGSLETWKSWITGALAVLTGVLTLLNREHLIALFTK